jgi:hypothetical protein
MPFSESAITEEDAAMIKAQLSAFLIIGKACSRLGPAPVTITGIAVCL